VAFETDADCGTWFNTPRHAAQTSIPPGVWLVGGQVSAGTYRTNANSGCYWERVSNFGGTLEAVIDNEFVSSAGQQLVEIRSSDAGFHTDGDCGTWTRISSSINGEVSPATRSDIRQNREMHDRLRSARR